MQFLNRSTTAVRRDELYSSCVGPFPRGKNGLNVYNGSSWQKFSISVTKKIDYTRLSWMFSSKKKIAWQYHPICGLNFTYVMNYICLGNTQNQLKPICAPLFSESRSLDCPNVSSIDFWIIHFFANRPVSYSEDVFWYQSILFLLRGQTLCFWYISSKFNNEAVLLIFLIL